MERRRIVSFVVGLPVAVVFAVATYYGIPQRRDVSLGFANHLFVWRAASAKLEPVPAGTALLTTDVERAADGSVFVMLADHSGALVFNPGRMAFGPLLPRPATVPERPPVHAEEFHGSEYLVSGGSDEHGSFLTLETFFVRASGMTARRTALFRHGGWSKGPTLTTLASRVGEEQPLTAAFLEQGERLALVVQSGALFVAGENDPTFRDVPLHGKLWRENLRIDLVASDGDKLLVITSDVYANRPSTATHVVDVGSGEVTNGPAIPGHGDVSGQALSGGGALLAAASEKVGVRNDAWVANVAAALCMVLVMVSLGWGLATRRLERTSFALGLAVGFIGGVVIALVVAWEAVVHSSHLW